MRTGRILLLALALALTVGTTASGAARTYFHDPLTSKAHYKPSRIQFSDLDIRHIHWRGWNHRTATGTGRARVNLCNPFCAAGPIVHKSVTLKAYRRHVVGTRRYYRCVHGRINGLTGPDSRVKWCNPEGDR
jgi:hypothetical protein